jgi:hypothetical protein
LLLLLASLRQNDNLIFGHKGNNVKFIFFVGYSHLLLTRIMNWVLAKLIFVCVHVDSYTRKLSAFPNYTDSNCQSKVCHSEKEGAEERGKIEPEKEKLCRVREVQIDNIGTWKQVTLLYSPIEMLQVRTSSQANHILYCLQAGEKKDGRDS